LGGVFLATHFPKGFVGISPQARFSNDRRGELEMPKIEANKGVITQVNVFSVSPENQQALIDLLIEAAKSASIHRSLDGHGVVNYAQCESHEAWEAVMVKLRQEGYLERNKKLGVAHPCLCEVVHTLEA
jgi:hypothetical protein